MSTPTYTVIRTMNGSESYRCDACGGLGSNEGQMRLHMASEHEDAKGQAERAVLEREFAAALEKARVWGQVQALEGTATLAREGVAALDETLARLPANSADAVEVKGQRAAFKAVLDWCDGEIARLTP